MPVIIDAFHKSLLVVISDKLSTKMAELSVGSAMHNKDEAATTAEKYAAQVAYIKALNDVMGWCDEISEAQYGSQRQTEAA